jgi:hypothetical protein
MRVALSACAVWYASRAFPAFPLTMASSFGDRDLHAASGVRNGRNEDQRAHGDREQGAKTHTTGKHRKGGGRT